MRLYGYSWAYGWAIEYQTDADLSAATSALFRLVGTRHAPQELAATITSLGGGQWLLSHVVAQGSLAPGAYDVVPQVDFPGKRLALVPLDDTEPHKLIIL